VISNAELLEQSQGDWEGLHRKEVYTDEVSDQMAKQHMDFCAPNGESLRMVEKRASVFVDNFIKTKKSENKDIVIGIFAHGGTIRCLLHHYLMFNDKMTWLIEQKNTTINEIFIYSKGISVCRINDAAHLTLD